MKIISKKNKAFSLVELMVAVGIIGSMSAVAVPNYAKFKAKSLQATAQQNLSNIYTLQNLYFTEHDEYGLAADISFAPNESKYVYYIATTHDSAAELGTEVTSKTTGGDQIAFKATAKSDGKLASCADKPDNWCVNQAKMLTNDPATPTDGKYRPCGNTKQTDAATTSDSQFSDGSCG